MKREKIVVAAMIVSMVCAATLARASNSSERRHMEREAMSRQFSWWPTDAQPAPVPDPEKGGHWWWPRNPGDTDSRLWGNRGYVYVNKVIVDYRSEELPPPQPQELRASLLIKKILRNIKIYYDFDSAVLRDDAQEILADATQLLQRHPETSILITGNTDVRGSEAYNERLGRRRAQAVFDYMAAQGVSPERIRIVSRGKLDAVAPVSDIVGMQRDRNAQFMVAEVEEVMMQYTGEPGQQLLAPDAVKIGEDRYLIQESKTVEGDVRVSTRDYVVKKGDTLWIIAKREMGSGHRWKYLHELNKDVIKNPNRLRPGTVLVIPVE